MGRPDGAATLDEVVEHAGALDRATSLPVSVDLENGYGRAAQDVARAVARVAGAGAVGASIEDYDAGEGIYPLEDAAQRVAAAADAARGLDVPFTLTARAENHIRGNPDLEDTIARLQAYERAGADVLYAPGLRNARGDPGGVRRGVQAGQRARAPRPDAERDRRGGRAAHQRRRRPDLGGRRRAGRRGRADPRPRRLLGPRRTASAAASGCPPAVSSA